LRKAIEALQRAASRATASSATLTLYGRALFLSNDLEASERTLEQATAVLPADPHAFSYLSAAAERRGHVSAARDALIKYVSLIGEDDQKRALSGRVAGLSLRMNEAPAAVAWARRAIDPEHPEPPLLALLADAQVRLGQIGAARATVAEGLARDPQNRALLQLRNRLGI
jgi:predicted Zn-dependent protease